ncbi:cupredoxin domain-containing protein [Natronococcus jeotgali]|uniref:Halocyanin-like protein (Copper-containing protein) 2 n=1 Tax=Natronococcus jeotgali DSM 18795 TaxID=1227498 RepID=L9WMP6_9EURY|nr:halocyanin [Natronococcus jeotgali]ELY50486.1 halocyanin-like protein (copper-containing protein) 2 [Natronococcus jeotgali DSM 18795]
MNGRGSTRRQLLAAGGAVLSAGVAGCIEGKLGGDDPLLGDPKPYLEVELIDGADGARIDPPIAHVVAGGTVEWTAESGTHEVAAYHPETHGDQRRLTDGADPWRSAVTPSSPFERVFDNEGVYDYACPTHEDRGAVGTVVVDLPAPEDEAGLERPSEAYPDAASEALEAYNERVRSVLADAHG